MPKLRPKSERGLVVTSPFQGAIRASMELFIAFVLVEPVLGAGKVLGPIIEVEFPAPRLPIGGLPIRVRRIPGQVSIALPGTPIL
jgi:hypothetical protein